MIEKQVLAFHMTVSRGRGLEHAETSTIDASTVAGFRLSPDVLEFRLEELKIPPLLKTRLRFELGIQTVADFVDRFDTPDLGQMGFGDRVINQVWNQVSKLARSGVEIYLRYVELESRTFLEIVHALRSELAPKHLLIFDNRICPVGRRTLTLQELGNRLHLSRERVRQIEDRLLNDIRVGSLSEMSGVIRQRGLEFFKPPVYRLQFWRLLHHPFLSGVAKNAASIPAAFVFLGRVFPSTFIVRDDTLALTKAVRRQRDHLREA